jgi:hypothetical protein
MWCVGGLSWFEEEGGRREEGGLVETETVREETMAKCLYALLDVTESESLRWSGGHEKESGRGNYYTSTKQTHHLGPRSEQQALRPVEHGWTLGFHV